MAHDATEHHTRVMYDLLVEKTAADPGGDNPDRNEEGTTAGMNPDHPTEEARSKGDIDAPWGEANTKGKKPASTENYSNAAYEQFIHSRQQMLEELFDSKKPASDTAQAIVEGQLGHASAGNFETRAPLLEGKAHDPIKAAEASFAAGLLDE